MDVSVFNTLRQSLEQQIIGQHHLVNSMLIALLSDGHILVEGMPGLAKTTAVKSLATAIEGEFHRIQFTPDLLPADLVGTDIYQQETGEFTFRPGPLFHNVLLADEINRAPPKVQSALLEAMAERQITVGQTTYRLPNLFMVLATQNPVEHEGTYTLPEAQLDRFLLYVKVSYPSRAEELAIIELHEQNAPTTRSTPAYHLSQADVFAARDAVMQVYIDPRLKEYIVDIVRASREPLAYDKDLHRWQRFGASPRASIALVHCARACAWLAGEKYVTPAHIQTVLPDILRHRLLLSFEAEADAISTDMFIERLLRVVGVP
ncbi:AAA family ATPase [Beggiatoa leptomitoformis]|uniref:AAA domain-containing protein n=1 Tax=Beggiatoa leptomitoformis TaxID=288004 RepID=A0A2N9YE76_9GAMM|nr:MoxR family ATPase [Beggiatoa leptomitoformis]ALG68882.1 AAA domain-containing protein [Beggiatoa leptomitoformis]AUI68746.1 AAA domain-containing protein [Beggiatoa leptomitoformis]